LENLSDGQRLGILQLEDIANSSSGGIRIERTWIDLKGHPAYAIVSMACDHIEHAPKKAGLRLMARERFKISIPSGFPFEAPHAWSMHKRFAGHPHVQWGDSLCLYQASATEWHANDGMFGFIDRLNMFLQFGAAGELNPVGAPLHPPAAFARDGVTPAVVVKENTPAITTTLWGGYAWLKYRYPHLCELIGWSETRPADTELFLAPSFLLSEPMPYEYPSKVSDLMKMLESRGVDRNQFIVKCLLAVDRNPKDKPLLIVVGTPMRGISGDTNLKQHLVIWKIHVDSPAFKALALGNLVFSDDEERADIGVRAINIFEDWATTSEDATVTWIPVHEERPEIVEKRDTGTNSEWFRGKTISLWGCGALGSVIAEIAVRGGVKKLILRDSGRVKPGILSRQLFEHEQIQSLKVVALEQRLSRINPEVEIVAENSDLLVSPLGTAAWHDNADLIIDTTGSNPVLQKLELVRHTKTEGTPPIISLAVGHKADKGIACVAPATYSGGPKDVLRKTKIKCSTDSVLEHFADEFFPAAPRGVLFQPEPGCSEPTFVGSAADVMSLASSLLNASLSQLIKESKEASACLIDSGRESGLLASRVLEFSEDIISADHQKKFQIRISLPAWKELLSQIAKNEKPTFETGGLMFGEFDDACRILWVSEVCGPPPDSKSSETRFECGTEGVADLQNFFKGQSRNSVQCVGLWHTHPNASPLPSTIDIEGMDSVVSATGANPRHSLLLIVGEKPKFPSVFTSVFSRNQKTPPPAGPTDVQSFPTTSSLRKRQSIGLALSGGGARAMAFHLGCLRALHKRGVLNSVEVLSTISGGSVIGAMYAYSNDSFEDFEARVVKALKGGLQLEAFLQLLRPSTLIGVILTWLVSGAAAVTFSFFALAAALICPAVHKEKVKRFLSPPFRRWFTRGHGLEKAFRAKLFGDLKLSSPQRNGLKVVINATELPTGTAFRFGSAEVGSWRLGKVESPELIRVSEAVAASACYPVSLPAFDQKYSMRKNGVVNKSRAILTDGGIYDNLGVTPLEPGRDSRFSTNVHPVDYIIACSAGPGPFLGDKIPFWWPSRMIQSFETVFRRVQDQSMDTLHSYVKSGSLKGFVLPYLGQIDSRLPCPPVNLVSRELVSRYPTDFRAMSTKNINLISKRGEQLTSLLIARYCPDL
jgi:integrative and conjugative element protein (TIGR02256 family)